MVLNWLYILIVLFNILIHLQASFFNFNGLRMTPDASFFLHHAQLNSNFNICYSIAYSNESELHRQVLPEHKVVI